MGFYTALGFYPVGIDGSLNEELCFKQPCLFFKYPDERFTDSFALYFRIIYAFQSFQETLSAIYDL